MKTKYNLSAKVFEYKIRDLNSDYRNSWICGFVRANNATDAVLKVVDKYQDEFVLEIDAHNDVQIIREEKWSGPWD